MHFCDNWVIIKINGDDPHYRVLTGTSGGFGTGDSWRMNSGITAVREDADYFYFAGSSGSEYECHKDSYCLRMNNAHIWTQMQKKNKEKGEEIYEMMPEDVDWTAVDWLIT